MHRRLIVNGVAISAARAPFVVRLYGSALGAGFCGGSLISPTAVLTAAHCVVDRNASYVGIRQSTVLATDVESDAELIEVIGKRLHPQYTGVRYGHDVAVLTLARSPQNYVTVPVRSSWTATTAAYVFGYGSDVYNGAQSFYLEAAHVRIYSRDECHAMLQTVLDPSNLCAGLDDADACSGDSGGPLVTYEDGRAVQVGIVSWGLGGYECGTLGIPGVYSLPEEDFAVEATVAPPNPPVNTSCACACVSNGFAVSSRCGCDAHTGEEAFCYTFGECDGASASYYVLGAWYRECDVCTEVRRDYRANDCCTFPDSTVCEELRNRFGETS